MTHSLTHTEVKSRADLTQFVGDPSTADDLYSQWIANPDRKWKLGRICNGYVATMRAMEGVGFLGITGRGATKFETYTCLVILLFI